MFKGFTPASISFLKDLTLNNNKDWFEQNRPVYEKHLLEPLKLLTVELGLTIKSIDDKIDIQPQINRTISKIYRDTRFSKDKSPFRTDLWISFKRPPKIWGNVPEFFFYFTPFDYQSGMGFYAATPENMAKFRDNILLNTDIFKKIIDKYNAQPTFLLFGEDYKKQVPNQLPTKFQVWFRKRNLYVSSIKKIDKIFFSEQLTKDIEDAFLFNADLYQFLIESIF